LHDTKVVRLLLDAEVNINLKDADGKTAIEIAIERKKRDAIIDMLAVAELTESRQVPAMTFEKQNSEQLTKRSALPLKTIALKSIIATKYRRIQNKTPRSNFNHTTISSSSTKPLPALIPDDGT
jgi:ankyrin repeat protein